MLPKPIARALQHRHSKSSIAKGYAMPNETDLDYLRILTNDYMEYSQEVKELEERQKTTRTAIADIMQAAELKSHTIKGVATLKMTGESERVSYDTAAIDNFVLELIDQNNEFADAVARRLRAYKKTTTVKPFLRIEKA